MRSSDTMTSSLSLLQLLLLLLWQLLLLLLSVQRSLSLLLLLLSLQPLKAEITIPDLLYNLTSYSLSCTSMFNNKILWCVAMVVCYRQRMHRVHSPVGLILTFRHLPMSSALFFIHSILSIIDLGPFPFRSTQSESVTIYVSLDLRNEPILMELHSLSK